MSDKKAKSLMMPGAIPTHTLGTRRLAPLFEYLSIAAGLIPSVEYNRKGKRNSTQIKVALGIVGLLLVLASDRNIFLIVIGFFMMASASFLPLSKLKKRDFIRKIKSKKTRKTTAYADGEIKHDGRRIELWKDGKMLRRVLTDRPFRLKKQRDQTHLWYGLFDKNDNKKRSAIWFAIPHTTDQVSDTQTTFDHNQADNPIILNDAKPLIERLEALHTAPRDLS